MKAVVEGVEPVAVVGGDRFLLPFDQPGQRREPLGRHRLAGRPAGLHLERDADEAGLHHRILGDLGHRGAALRADVQEPKLGQPLERLAHGLARDAHLRRDLHLRDAGVGRQVERHDSLLQHVENLVRDRGQDFLPQDGQGQAGGVPMKVDAHVDAPATVRQISL